jgi:hypothetical protein
MLPPLIDDTCKLAVQIHQPYAKSADKEEIERGLDKTKLKYKVLYSEF